MALNMAKNWVRRALAGEIEHSKIMGLARHGLTTLGGALVAKGVIDESLAEPLVGVGLTAFGFVWSMIVKQKEPA